MECLSGRSSTGMAREYAGRARDGWARLDRFSIWKGGDTTFSPALTAVILLRFRADFMSILFSLPDKYSTPALLLLVFRSLPDRLEPERPSCLLSTS